MQHTIIDSKTGEVVEVVEMETQPDPTTEEFAEEETVRFIETDVKYKALALLLAEIVEKVYNVTPAVARQQVRARIKANIKSLL